MDKQGNAHELRQRVDAAVEASKANRFSQVGGRPFQIKFFSTPTPTPTPSGTGPTPTPSPTSTPTRTPRSPTPTPSPTPSKTATPTPSPTPTPSTTPKQFNFIALEGSQANDLLLQENDGKLIIEVIPPTPTPSPTPTSTPFSVLCVTGALEGNGQYQYGFWGIGTFGTLPGYRFQINPLNPQAPVFYIFKNEFNSPNAWNLVREQNFVLTYLYFNPNISQPTVPLNGWQSLLPVYDPPPNLNSSPCPTPTFTPTGTVTPTPTPTPTPDIFNWQQYTIGNSVNASWNVAGIGSGFDPSYLLVSSGGGIVARSITTETNWNLVPGIPPLFDVRKLAFGNSTYIGATFDSYRRSTGNGFAWSAALPFSTITPRRTNDIIYGDKFVVVPSATTGVSQIVTSLDGFTWNIVNLPVPGGILRSWSCIGYGGGGNYILLGDDGANTGLYSTDGGSTWQQTSQFTTLNGRWISIAYGNGVYVAVSQLGTQILRSTDGINWTEATLNTSLFINGTNSSVFRKVIFGDGKFVILPLSGNRTAYSTNGINWIQTNLPSNSPLDLAFGNNTFLLGAQGSVAWLSNQGPGPTPTPSSSPTPTPTPSNTNPTPTPSSSSTPTPTPTPSPSVTAEIIEDSAANYITFNNASNQGSGFQPWSITTVNNAGQYIFSTAQRGVGNIDTADKSWASWANPNLFNVNRLNRTLQNPLTIGTRLSAAIAVAFRNGNKGVRVKEGGTNGRVVWEFAVTNDVYRVSSVTSDQSWPRNLQDPLNALNLLPYSQTSIFNIYVFRQTSSIYNISLERRGDGVLSTTTLNSLDDVNTLEFYIENTEQGNALNDLYFNSIKVAPFTPPPTPSPTQSGTPTPTPTSSTTPPPPAPSFACVSAPNQFVRGTYYLSGSLYNRPQYLNQQTSEYIMVWYSPNPSNPSSFSWRILDGGNNTVYTSTGDVPFPWLASWGSGVTVVPNACPAPTPTFTPSPSPSPSPTPTPSSTENQPTGEDSAANYTTWTNGSDQGTAFQPWVFSNTGNAGQFISSSVTDGFANINTDSKAFGIYGHTTGGDQAQVTRLLNTALSPGYALSATVAVNFRNGFKEIGIIDSIDDSGLWRLQITNDSYLLFITGNASDLGTGLFPWTYNTVSVTPINIVANQISSNEFTVTVWPESNFSLRNVSTLNGTISGIYFRINSTESSAPIVGNSRNNLMFNKLKVYELPIPTPTPTPTPSPTESGTPTPTPTPSPSPTPSGTVTPTPSPTPTPSNTDPTPTPSPTSTINLEGFDNAAQAAYSDGWNDLGDGYGFTNWNRQISTQTPSSPEAGAYISGATHIDTSNKTWSINAIPTGDSISVTRGLSLPLTIGYTLSGAIQSINRNGNKGFSIHSSSSDFSESTKLVNLNISTVGCFLNNLDLEWITSTVFRFYVTQVSSTLYDFKVEGTAPSYNLNTNQAVLTNQTGVVRGLTFYASGAGAGSNNSLHFNSLKIYPFATSTPTPSPTESGTPTPTPTPSPSPSSSPTPTPSSTPSDVNNTLFDTNSFVGVISEPYLTAINTAAARWATYIKVNPAVVAGIRTFDPNWSGLKLNNYQTINQAGSYIASCGVDSYVDVQPGSSGTQFCTYDFNLNVNLFYASTYNATDWANIMTHELGHALGIGIYWNSFFQPQGAVPPTDFFLSGSAYPSISSAYGTILGSGRPVIALESSGGGGTSSAHWENNFRSSAAQGSQGFNYPGLQNELMVGFYSPSTNFVISNLSIKALVDFGYVEKNPGANEGVPTLVNF